MIKQKPKIVFFYTIFIFEDPYFNQESKIMFCEHNLYIALLIKQNMNKWIELLLGLILVIGAIVAAFYSQSWGSWNFWVAAGEFFKGAVFWGIICLGSLFM